VKSWRNVTGVQGVAGSSALGSNSSRNLRTGDGVKSRRRRMSSRSCWQQIGTVIYQQHTNTSASSIWLHQSGQTCKQLQCWICTVEAPGSFQ